MDLREQIRQEIASAINDCIRNDTSFRSYADAAIEAVMEVLEKQEPVAKVHIHKTGGNAGVAWSARPLNDFDSLPLLRDGDKLYALPSAHAQPTPSKQDASVRKAWARFSHELHRSPDAPYPGMADAFEQHFSQSFTDREWMAEASTWAAAWKAAKRHGAQPAPSFADAYQGAMEEVAIWKKRALEAEELNRKFVAEINGPVYMGEPAQPAPSVPDGWLERGLAELENIRNRFDDSTLMNDKTLIERLFIAMTTTPEDKP